MTAKRKYTNSLKRMPQSRSPTSERIDAMAVQARAQERQQQQANAPTAPDWLTHINAVETRLTNRIDRLFFAILGAGGGIIIALIGLITAIILKG